MAKVTFTAGNIAIEVEGDKIKSLVQELSPMIDFFGTSEEKCGRCGSDDTRPQHRKGGEYDYYSYICNKCGGELKFGQMREGGKLFAKRKLDDDSYDKEHYGWLEPYWKRDDSKSSSTPNAPTGVKPDLAAPANNPF